MSDPLEVLGILTDTLVDGGILHVGVYAKHKREPVTQMRGLIFMYTVHHVILSMDESLLLELFREQKCLDNH